MAFEKEVCELLAFLVEELLDKKPHDPLEHLLQMLSFPFRAREIVGVLNPAHCRSCSKTAPFSTLATQDSCCVFELRQPFGRDDCFQERLTEFLNSKETLLIVVGDADTGRSSEVQLCDCCGSGKSRLCRWLDVPGQFFHKRKVLRVSGDNVSSLVDYLESADDSPFSNKLSQLDTSSVVPTLTLIDGIEPPHSVLHVLLQQKYFRAEKRLICHCGQSAVAAAHKTILFARPGVFFKFPLPCSIGFLSRRERNSRVGVLKSQQTVNPSFSALVGPAHTPKKRRVQLPESHNGLLNPTSDFGTIALQATYTYKEEPYLRSPSFLKSLLFELGQNYNRTGTLLSASGALSKTTLSRCRLERLLAQIIVDEVLAIPFDLSQAPELVNCIVQTSKVDYYFARMLQQVYREQRGRKPTNRLLAGNLLCLASASQQTLSPFPLAATVTDMLHSYLTCSTRCSSSGDEVSGFCRFDSGVFSHAQMDALEVLNLQNIVVESFDYVHPSSSLIARNLLDVRGAIIEYSVLSSLRRGDTIKSFKHQPSSPWSPVSTADGEGCSSHLLSSEDSLMRPALNPVLLLSDVTDVGRDGYEGHAASTSRRAGVVGPHALACFVVNVVEEGVVLVVTVEKNSVVARTSFSRSDESDEANKVYWSISLSAARSIVDAVLLREAAGFTSLWTSGECLALLFLDGSVGVVNLDLMRDGMKIQVSSKVEGESETTAVHVIASPPFSAQYARSPPRHSDESGKAMQERKLSHRQSFVRHDSVVTLDVPVSQETDLAESEASVTMLCERCIAIVDHKNLVCEDPCALAMSYSWIAAASHDSDIVCVAAHPLLCFNTDSREVSDQSVILQGESNVSALCIVGDSILLTGSETGTVQGFDLPNGKEVFESEHHEARINVIRSVTSWNDSNKCCHSSSVASTRMFIVGSDDCTMTVFCVEDTDPLRTLRVHAAPVIDIVASHAYRSHILVSADRSGVVTVSTLDPNALPLAGTMLWSATFFGARTISLSVDGSWLTCCRTQNTPVAVPLSEWCRQGTGQFHQKAISALHVTRNERYLLTGGDDGIIFVWDLHNYFRFKSSFQQHTRNASINSISTSADASRVVSADASNLFCLWWLETGNIIRILMRTPGGGFARFIDNDYLIVQTSRGIKVFDNEEKLVASTNLGGDSAAFDCYMAPADVYDLCFAPASRSSACEPTSTKQTGFSSSSEDDSSPKMTHIKAPSVEQQHVVSQKQLQVSSNDLGSKMKQQCFIGISRGNVDSGLHYVSIFALGDLETSLFELSRGEVEDEFGDEEELCHTDRITAFTFLPPRPEALPSRDSDAAPPPPTILLAATGAEDLTVILWSWRKQEPLKLLRHTNFVTSCTFWYPSLGARSTYSATELRTLSKVDPSFELCRDGAVVCNLITSQYCNADVKESLRVFEVRENNRAFQKRLLGIRCNQLPNAATYSYNMLNVNEVSTSTVPVPSGEVSSVRCVAVRPSDGLICTGDQTSQVIFWRLLCSRAHAVSPPGDAPQSPHTSDEDEESDLMGKGEVRLRPLRRIVSRI